MMYNVISKVKGTNSEQLTGKVQEFILRSKAPGVVFKPDAWCDACRKFASENGYEVSFHIDRAYTVMNGALDSDNAIISTFKLKK